MIKLHLDYAGNGQKIICNEEGPVAYMAPDLCEEVEKSLMETVTLASELLLKSTVPIEEMQTNPEERKEWNEEDPRLLCLLGWDQIQRLIHDADLCAKYRKLCMDYLTDCKRGEAMYIAIRDRCARAEIEIAERDKEIEKLTSVDVSADGVPHLDARQFSIIRISFEILRMKAGELAAERDALKSALMDAAMSLQSIEEQAGRDECMMHMEQVRGYAHSRSVDAHASLTLQKMIT